jgi:hypothetical protein
MPEWNAAKKSNGICGEKVEGGSHFYHGGKGRTAKDPMDTDFGASCEH